MEVPLNHYFKKTIPVAAAFCDHFLFALAAFFLIPPVPSVEGEIYNPWKGVVLAVLSLGGSRFIAIRMGNETWLGWILKTIIFVVFGFVIYLRVQIAPI